MSFLIKALGRRIFTPKKLFFSPRIGFSNNNSGDNEANMEILEADQEYPETMSQKIQKSYVFLEKSLALPIEFPLFPFSRFSINLGETRTKQFQKMSPTFLTVIVPKEDYKKDKTPQIKDFYSVGTYCSVEFDNNSMNIQLQGLHRVEIQSVEKIEIKLDESAEVFEEEGKTLQKVENARETALIEETEADPQRNIDEAPVTKKKESKSLTKEIIAILESKRNQIQKNLTEEDPNYFLSVQISKITEPEFDVDISLETKLKHLIDIYSKILYMNKGQIPLVNYNLQDANRIVDSLGGVITSMGYYKKQELQEAFEVSDLSNRLNKIHILAAKYLSFLQNFSDVGKIAQNNLKMRKAQEFYDEVFKIVKGAVEGEKGKAGVINILRKKLKGKKVPAHVQKVFDEELQKFYSIDEMSSESNIIRTFLDWVVSLPYGLYSEDSYDIKKSKEILDEDHYGMEDIKDRILEFIAVGKLKGSLTGKILLLVGPPGVGKTSLASSIAKALNRKYTRISMGGESDSSFLKGHRKTYIGAYPGKIIQALKDCQTENCVILLDEIDKLGRSEIHGDPQSNLLEVLDPAQNSAFTDNYLDFPVDLSKVLFICSANSLDTISQPLIDRMDVIQLSSYTFQEKKQIFTRHIYPRVLKETAVPQQYFTLSEQSINHLIEDYCREPGVRSLEKYTRKILEKVAFQYAKNPSSKPLVIDNSNLLKLLGLPKFSQSRFYEQTPIGVVVGLAYTEYGGSLIFIEAAQSSFFKQKEKEGGDKSFSTPGLKITGSLGTVMKESMHIAYTYAKHFANKMLKNSFLEHNEVHIHAPEGATPKDGPSAGITITSALISLALRKPVKQNVAMTGEVSLRGKVMKIGGIKEKILAAKREKIMELIVPKDNEEDVRMLKDYIKEGIIFHYADDYLDVFKVLFPDVRVD